MLTSKKVEIHTPKKIKIPFQTVVGGMTEIEVLKNGDVGGAPDYDVGRRFITAHQRAPDDGCRPDAAARRCLP